MKEVIEVLRDDLKKHLIYWERDNKSKNWTLYLKYQQDKVVKRIFRSYRPAASIVTISAYGMIKITKDDLNPYMALIPNDTRSNFKINLAGDSNSYKVVGLFNSLEAAMESVLEANNPLSSNIYI